MMRNQRFFFFKASRRGTSLRLEPALKKFLPVAEFIARRRRKNPSQIPY
jgi:hypothetical protein